MQFSEVDFRDIQALVRFGHGHLCEGRFYFMEVTDPVKAREWVASHIADVTTAVPDRGAPHAMQIAFTCEGLRKLTVPEDVLGQFSLEFRGGMVDPNRSRRLGDIDSNDPKCWAWGVPAASHPDVLILVYTTAKAFKDWNEKITAPPWSAAFRQIYALSTVRKDDLEPFGFVDGVSQPVLDWTRNKPTRVRDTASYANLSALGEFLLGYPNEYGRYTDRPLLGNDDKRARVLPLAEDEPGMRDFGRNGTYLVLRDLRQNVSAFRTFVRDHSRQSGEEAHALAAAMSGRVPADQHIFPVWPKEPPPSPRKASPPWHAPGAVDDPKEVIPSGGPINPISKSAIEGIDPSKMADVWLDQFTFNNDPDGTSCPYGAHIRRANPRNADLPEGTRGMIGKLLRTLGFDREHTHGDLLSSTRFHRILRRGRAYEGQLDQTTGAERERGLLFIALNANISRQFEFIQTSWIANSKFNGLDEDDPLIGGRKRLITGAPINYFTRPLDNGLTRRLHDVPQFVMVRGGAYFFLPGLAALRYIAAD
jgi:deferrochelatase/peroxidase EfeB